MLSCEKTVVPYIVKIDLLFPDFSLSQQEIDFLETYKKISCRKLKNPVPTKWSTPTNMTDTFLKACIEIATESGKAIAVAAFVTAIIQEERIRLPLLHSECLPNYEEGV